MELIYETQYIEVIEVEDITKELDKFDEVIFSL